jgi:hypothetical protein
MEGWQTWFWGLVLIVMLVIGGVEVNPGPPVEQEKIDQILIHMQNQEKESKSGKKFTRDPQPRNGRNEEGN